MVEIKFWIVGVLFCALLRCLILGLTINSLVMDCPPFFFEMLAAHLNESEANESDVLLHFQILKDVGNLLFKKGNTQVARGIPWLSFVISYSP